MKTELKTAGAIATAGFFLMAGYELMRSSTPSIFLEAYSTDYLSWVLSGVPLILILALAGYNALLSSSGPRRTLCYSSALCMVVILGCIFGVRLGHNWMRWLLYIVSEVYVMIIIEQYWSFAVSVFSADFMKRFSGPFVGIGTIGAILGGLFTSAITAKIGSIWLPAITVILLFPALLFGELAHFFSPVEEYKQNKNTSFSLGVATLKENPLLKNIFFIVLATQVLSTLLGLHFQTLLKVEFPLTDERTAFSGKFYSSLNGACLLLQFVVAPFLIKKVSTVWILMALPFINLIFAVIGLVHPSFFTVAAGLFVFKMFDYSLFRATKELLYVPLSFEARYRSKEIIDVFGYRFSKGMTSLGVTLLKSTTGFGTGLYVWGGLISALVWSRLLIKSRKSL